MFWYIFLMCVLLFVMALCIHAKHYGYLKIEYKFVWLSSFSLLFFMALRKYYIGIDTREYVRAFSQIKYFTLGEALFSKVYGRGMYTLALEPGYRLFNWVTGLLSKNDQAIIISGSILIIVLLTVIVRNWSSAPVLSLFMYLTLGIFQTHMNVSRNAMAIFICYYGIKYIKKRQLIRYLLCVLLGVSFHYSAIIFVPLYWLINYVSFTDKRFHKAIVMVTGFALVFPFIKNIFINFVPFSYRGYFSRNSGDLSGIPIGILYLFLFFFTVFFLQKEERPRILEEEKIGSWMLIINTLFFALSFSMGNAGRAAALFGPYIIIYIPNLLERTKYTKIIKFLVVLICVGAYIGRMAINNIGITIPYRFFFSNNM